MQQGVETAEHNACLQRAQHEALCIESARDKSEDPELTMDIVDPPAMAPEQIPEVVV